MVLCSFCFVFLDKMVENLNKSNHLSLVIPIALCSENHHLHVLAGVLVNFLYPELDFVEASLVGDVVDDQEPHDPAIVTFYCRLVPVIGDDLCM